MEIGSIGSKEARLKIEVVKLEGTKDAARLVPNNIFGDTNTLEAQYNPSSLNVGYGQKISSKKEVGNSENTQTVTGKEDDEMSFELMFDTSLDVDSNGNYPSVKDKYVSKFQSLVKENDDEDDILCRISWGSIISFIGILINLKVNYIMFSSDGLPIRAKLELKFSQKSVSTKPVITSGKAGEALNKKRVRLNPGDCLGLLAALEYGNIDKWKSIASANNIDNPRIILPGAGILIP